MARFAIATSPSYTPKPIIGAVKRTTTTAIELPHRAMAKGRDSVDFLLNRAEDALDHLLPEQEKQEPNAAESKASRAVRLGNTVQQRVVQNIHPVELLLSNVPTQVKVASRQAGDAWSRMSKSLKGYDRQKMKEELMHLAARSAAVLRETQMIIKNGMSKVEQTKYYAEIVKASKGLHNAALIELRPFLSPYIDLMGPSNEQILQAFHSFKATAIKLHDKLRASLLAYSGEEKFEDATLVQAILLNMLDAATVHRITVAIAEALKTPADGKQASAIPDVVDAAKTIEPPK